MKLSEIVDYVCAKVRATDAESLVRCADFIRRRYEIIWHQALWRDSVFQLDWPIYPENGVGTVASPNDPELAQHGIIYLPQVIDKVLAIRGGDWELPATAPEQLYRSSLDEFERTGDPVNFVELGRAVMEVWPYFAGVLTGGSFSLVAGNSADAGVEVHVDYVDVNYTPKTVDIALAASGGATITQEGIVIDRVSKPTTTGTVTLMSPYETTIVLAASDTIWPRRPRVRLTPAPTTNQTLKILAKRTLVPLVEDDDEPILTNVEPILIALAQGDMLEYGRQYGKAQLKHQEGVALLDQFSKGHVVQNAQRQRIIPEVGDVSGTYWEDQSKGYW